MTAKSGDAKKQSGRLSAEVARLAKDFRLEAGKVAMPEDAFRKWRESFAASAKAEKKALATDVVALAVRFHEEAGAAAVEGIAQLVWLASELIGASGARRAFKAAGAGWDVKSPPAAGGGWSKR